MKTPLVKHIVTTMAVIFCIDPTTSFISEKSTQDSEKHFLKHKQTTHSGLLESSNSVWDESTHKKYTNDVLEPPWNKKQQYHKVSSPTGKSKEEVKWAPYSIPPSLLNLLTKEDRSLQVKVLQNDREASCFLKAGQTTRLVFPLESSSPLTVMVTPCEARLRWSLMLRTHNTTKILMRNSSAASNVTETYNHKDKLIHLESQANNHQQFKGNITENNYKTKDSKKSRQFRRRRMRILEGRRKRLKRVRERYRINREDLASGILQQYIGHKPWWYQVEDAQPGLYVLQITALDSDTQTHVYAASKWKTIESTSQMNVSTKTPYNNGLTFSWKKNYERGDQYCLVVSAWRPFTSLCQARAAERYISQSPTEAPQRHPAVVVMGCTDHHSYTIPERPHTLVHVAVWTRHGGPPVSRTVIRPLRRVRVPKLQPGQLMALTPSSGGHASAKFRLRRGAQRLHVVAVACGANLNLQIKAADGSRVASAAGGQGALFLKVRHSQPSMLKMVLTTTPPGAARSLLLAASTTARGLPLPRLPRKTKISIISTECNKATLQWRSASGSPNYCILLQEDLNPDGHHTRALTQCDWEATLQHPEDYLISQCGPGTNETRRQRYLIKHLLPAHAYIVTVLVQQPITGHVLALKSKFFKTKEECSL